MATIKGNVYLLAIAVSVIFGLLTMTGCSNAHGDAAAAASNEEYKVMRVPSESQMLQDALNENAKKGWKVKMFVPADKVGVDNMLILVR